MKVGDVVICPEPKCKKHFTIREDLLVGGRLDKYLRCPYCGQVHSFFLYQCMARETKDSLGESKDNGKAT